jgi:hypothetical protein
MRAAAAEASRNGRNARLKVSQTASGKANKARAVEPSAMVWELRSSLICNTR